MKPSKKAVSKPKESMYGKMGYARHGGDKMGYSKKNYHAKRK